MKRVLVAVVGLSACTAIEGAPSRPRASFEGARPEAVAPDPPPVRIARSETEAPKLPSLRAIARRASRYTVFVRSGGAYGAGVVLDRSGHLLTCNHVLLGNTAEVQFEGGAHTMSAAILERAPEIDLALLELNEPLPADVEPASVGAITEVERGDEVFSMGAPRRMRFSFHRGIVSFVGRRFDRDDVVYLQTDLAMSPGSSGGPVLDRQGELIGIATFILRNSEGLAFAVPVDYALRRFAAIDASRETPRRRARRDAFDAWLRAHADQGGGAVDSVLTTDAPAAAQ